MSALNRRVWDVFEVLVLTITFVLLATMLGGCATFDAEKFVCYKERTDGRVTCESFETCVMQDGNSPATCSLLCSLLCTETREGTCFYEMLETSPGKYITIEKCSLCFEHKKERRGECFEEASDSSVEEE